MARIAELLNTTADYLLGLYRPVSNVSAPEELFFGSYTESLIPVIGTVKAGYGALAFEEDYGQEYARVKDPANYFYLVVRGDSMEPRIQDGDLALVHKQDTLENGDLGVLIYGDEGEGTLKRYIQRGNCVVLQPFNPAYHEMVIKGEDLNHLHIAGRVVETKAKGKLVDLKMSSALFFGHIQRKFHFNCAFVALALHLELVGAKTECSKRPPSANADCLLLEFLIWGFYCCNAYAPNDFHGKGCWYCRCPMNPLQKSPAPSPRQSMTAKITLLHGRLTIKSQAPK